MAGRRAVAAGPALSALACRSVRGDDRGDRATRSTALQHTARPNGGGWHALSPEQALDGIASGANGLSSAEARRRLADVGPNALPEPRRAGIAAIFLRQFRSPLIYLLFAASGVAFALGERRDALVILGAVTLNALIGAFQDRRAQRSLDALRRLASLKAGVLRDGREERVEAREVVPGDVLLLAAGDAVPADARLLDGAALEIAEAALTGESLPVAKEYAPLAPDTLLADRRNMVYGGTHVTAGRARAVVVATGPHSEIGRIAQLAESTGARETPLEQRIAQFGRFLSVAALVLVAVILALGLARGLSFAEVFMLAISQMVSMVPEGLPVAMTIALAVGVQRMARRGAIVRQLAAVETLGSTTVICTDKTGTLTRNEMTAIRVWLPAGRSVAVSGVGYAPDGGFEERGAALDALADPDLRELLEAGALCNDAHVEALHDERAEWQALGDPTEAALLVLAAKGGIAVETLRGRLPRRAELPFDPGARMMATQHEMGAGACVLVKGAPELIEPLCAQARCGGGDAPFDAAARDAFHAAVRDMASGALRVLALARVDGLEIDGRAGFAALHGRATLLGLVGQIDPPRPEVMDAVRECRVAGIRPVVVTGDHAATGLAVARTLGIARAGDVAVDGRELEKLTDEDLERRLDSVSVFARVHPAQKLRIVEAYQRRGDVVAMTGDGVNDAPALARADVGVAMGVTGTEVAKQAAKIVVTDDNFATIVVAVAEGRAIYRNLKKLILYLFSTSAAEIVVLLTALLAGYPPPLAAVQILWINLVTDAAVTVNLVMEPAEGDEMRRRPVARDERLLTRGMLIRMALMVPAMAISTLGWYTVRLASGAPFEVVRTETFTVLAVCQWFNAMNSRSGRRSALRGVLGNRWLLGGLAAGNVLQAAVVFWPPLNRLFYTVPIELERVPHIALVASLVLWVEEARKWMLRRRDRAAGPKEE
ncbi:MAG: haloacid dehalogenase [Proteobacteria bacterium]|nr:MAG: haloacid dehalogenase [Pseudomonadota bacterium]